MKPLPPDAVCYKRTPEFTADTMPAGLARQHSTKPGVWGRICVIEGALHYRIHGAQPEEHVIKPGKPGVIEPGVPHEVEPIGEVRFQVEFLRRAADA